MVTPVFPCSPGGIRYGGRVLSPLLWGSMPDDDLAGASFMLLMEKKSLTNQGLHHAAGSGAVGELLVTTLPQTRWGLHLRFKP